ncbi:MAG: 50S ribosomal protein L25 [Chitinivibrionales bacterium]|nr:50S ribosomal protein L25 [Chitinivibrionales bacterium]
MLVLVPCGIADYPSGGIVLDIIKLKSRSRNGTGKSYTRKARINGWLPAAYYGRGISSESIEVDYHEFVNLLRSKKTNHLIDLQLPEKQDSVAVVKEIQRDPLIDDKVFHVDFQHVSMGEKVTVKCPLEIVGTPIGVKVGGGVLSHPVRHLTIESLPREIPEKITVDVSELSVGQSIHIKDLDLPDLTLKDSPEEVIAMVNISTKEKADAADKEEGGEAAPEEAAEEGAES